MVISGYRERSRRGGARLSVANRLSFALDLFAGSGQGHVMHDPRITHHTVEAPEGVSYRVNIPEYP
jgi:hypothetical protein